MRNERGIALVFVLFLVTTISALAVSLTFLANSETYASANYRLVTQARYGAEAGVQKIGDFLLDPTQYNAATVTPALANVDATKSPVQWCTAPGNAATCKDIVLNSDPAKAQYPDAAMETAFSNASKGNLTAGSTTMAFSGQAKLLTEYAFLDRFSGNNVVAQ